MPGRPDAASACVRSAHKVNWLLRQSTRLRRMLAPSNTFAKKSATSETSFPRKRPIGISSSGSAYQCRFKFLESWNSTREKVYPCSIIAFRAT